MSNLSLKHLLLAATVAITGTFSCRQAEELSSEAEIVSFTFDTSVEANSIVTSVPVINGDSITFSVSSDSVSERLSALVPTITVSENATVSPASGSAVDFSQGSVTFTVTAQDGVTTRAYFAKAVTGTTDNPDITYPIDEQLAGEYKGLLNITLGGEPVGSDIARNITVAKVDDETVSLTLEDFSFMGMELGTIKVDSCKIVGSDIPEYDYTLSGEQTLTLNVIGEQHVTVDGGFADNTISLTISIDFNGTPVDVTFEGTKLTGNESSEALITSFTFDASNSANAAVFGTTIDQDNRTVSVSMNPDTAGAWDLTALVPTIEVSQGATVTPASGSAIDLSNGKSVTFTVVAENGTENTYTVSASGSIYFYDFETWEAGTMYNDILNPAGWATCNDAVALIKNMGPIFGGGITYDGEYPVRPTDNGLEGKGVIIESVFTTGGEMMGQKIPAVTSGTIFLGTFNAMAAMQNPMATTEFGIIFEDKPLTVTGWLKYTPGEDFYNENGNIIDQQDLGTVNAVLYEVSSEDETLNGENIYTSEAICATGSFETAGAAEFTQFTVDMEYVKDYDPSKTYKLAVIFAASKEGNQYRAASGSIMVVDSVTIICE
ncbi:MAG TPA: PCMD domain-containing protein [Candidatus Coprenecus pullicola]|nr:PCMD domain-containing protein [Candidatus Coprenecus pullicola]